MKEAMDHQKRMWTEHIRRKIERVYIDSILFIKRELTEDGKVINYVSLKGSFLDDIANFIIDLFESKRKNGLGIRKFHEEGKKEFIKYLEDNFNIKNEDIKINKNDMKFIDKREINGFQGKILKRRKNK